MGFDWIGPVNGPVDYMLNGLAVQLKTAARPNSMTNTSVRSACTKLRNVVNNGWNGNTFNSARLDIMIPANQNIADYENWMRPLINSEFPNIQLNIGYFNN